jgi:hypothetical protein
LCGVAPLVEIVSADPAEPSRVGPERRARARGARRVASVAVALLSPAEFEELIRAASGSSPGGEQHPVAREEYA